MDQPALDDTVAYVVGHMLPAALERHGETTGDTEAVAATAAELRCATTMFEASRAARAAHSLVWQELRDHYGRHDATGVLVGRLEPEPRHRHAAEVARLAQGVAEWTDPWARNPNPRESHGLAEAQLRRLCQQAGAGMLADSFEGLRARLVAVGLDAGAAGDVCRASATTTS